MDLSAASTKTPKFTFAGATATAKCVKVYDGDTATFVFSVLGLQPYKYSCRMLGYNSAEIRGGSEAEKTSARAARDFLSGMILDKIVELSFGDFDKYGRPLVEVYVGESPRVHVNALMVEAGHGAPYTGRGEKKW